MRVAVITESFLPHVNGVTGSVVKVLQHLRDRGHSALVLTPGLPPTAWDGARVVGLPSVALPGYPQVRVSLASARSFGKHLAAFRPDVVHLASPFTVGRPAVRAAAQLGIPVVAVYQTDVAGFAARYGVPWASEAAWRHLRSVHEQAALTLAPSRWSADDLRRHGVPRVGLWPRGVDTAAFSPARRDRGLRDLLAGPGEVLVGYVGRLAAEKHLDDLRVLQDLPGVRLVLIGDGPERDALTRALPRAAFLGFLRGPQLWRAVASLDVAVQPGPYETFCQSAQEAMASGVPVVAVDSGGTAELVDPSRTGWLYPPGDLEHLRAVVQDLAGDARKRRAMGLAARVTVRERTWPVVCDQLLEHYRAVLDGAVPIDASVDAGLPASSPTMSAAAD